jgi:hypothetical protein
VFEHIPRLEPIMQILAGVKATDAETAALGDGAIGLGARTGRYGRALIDQLGELLGSAAEPTGVQELALPGVQLGRASQSFLEHVKNYSADLLDLRVRVSMPQSARAKATS